LKDEKIKNLNKKIREIQSLLNNRDLADKLIEELNKKEEPPKRSTKKS
jgi:hypothetical protein